MIDKITKYDNTNANSKVLIVVRNWSEIDNIRAALGMRLFIERYDPNDRVIQTKAGNEYTFKLFEINSLKGIDPDAVFISKPLDGLFRKMDFIRMLQGGRNVWD